MAKGKDEPIKQSRMLLIAVIVGVIAVVLLQVYINQVKERFNPGQTVAYLAARENIPAFSKLEPRFVGQKPVYQEYAPSDAIPLSDYEEVLGQAVNRDIQTGELIRLSDFQLTSGMPEVTETIPSGFRAVTLPVNQVTSNAGLIRPGDHVDVVGTFIKPRNVAEGAGDRATVTIMQNMLVLAVGQQIGEALSGGESGLERRTGLQYSTITLLADLRRAEILTFAMDRGNLTFLLRNPNDLETAQVEGADFGDIFEVDKRRAMQEEWNTKIEVLKGKGK
jgi:pilus assembly protein CpaB